MVTGNLFVLWRIDTKKGTNMHITTKYIDEEVVVKKSTYEENGRLCLRLQSTDGEALMTVSSNLGEFEIANDSIFVKTYSENEGVMEALIEAGVLTEPKGSVSSGFCDFPICRVLV